MAASENFWMAQSFYFVLCVFSYIIASSAGASLAFFLEPELGHDSAEAAVVVAQSHHAVHVLALAVHRVTAPDGILVGNVAVGALVDFYPSKIDLD
jgi:hypothetical protein